MAFPGKINIYTDCFYSAVEASDVWVVDGIFAGRWLLKNLQRVDYVHVHWPSAFYYALRRYQCLRKFAMLLFFLGLVRWRGVRLVWTIHNLYPHDRCVIPQLDILCRKLLVRMGRLFFVHGPSAEAEVLREFPKVAGRTVVIDHGHWVGYYPNTITCRAARSQLRLTESDYVFLFIGLCKPYKNLEGLIAAFEELPREAVLLIAGKFQDSAYEAAIRAAVERSPARIILRAGFVPDEDMQIYLRACNVVTAPYKEILSSGTAMLALSFGRPVIAPAAGCLKDLVVDGCGFLYDPAQPDHLRDAMRTAMQSEFDEEHIIKEVLKHDWRRTAEIFVESLSRDFAPGEDDCTAGLQS
jgi:beta-1,4-mannosyltransferase